MWWGPKFMIVGLALTTLAIWSDQIEWKILGVAAAISAYIFAILVFTEKSDDSE